MVWGFIYLCMGLAAWLVWQAPGHRPWAWAIYLSLLVVNCLSWPPLFFGGHRKRTGAADAMGEHGCLLREPQYHWWHN